MVNRMIMKDNDAGLISGNSAKASHLLEKVSHIDPTTYNRLLDLQKELQKPEVAEWYQQELLFTPANFKTVKDNVDQAVGILTARKEKSLFLDASLSVALGIEGDKKQETPETPGHWRFGHPIYSGDYLVRWSLGKRCEESASGCDDGSALVESRCRQVSNSAA